MKFKLSDWLMLLVAVIWGMNFSLIKIALREIPPLSFNCIRLVLASAILLVWLLVTEGNIKVKKEHLLKIVLLAVSGYTIYQYIFILGIHMTNASNTGVLFGIAPIAMALFSVLFKYETVKPIAWIGILLGFAGVYITIVGKSGGFRFSVETLKGDLLILAAVLIWSHYSVAAKPLLRIYSPLKFTTLTMSIGSVLFFPFAVGELTRIPYSAVSFKAWSLLVFSGVMALSVGLIIWFYSIKKVGNTQTAIYGNLPVVLAVVFAWLILSESIALSLIIGAAVIFLGIFFTLKGRET
ncbi:MAG: DMT family transporter [bacterium]|nr:DMT family transporter [bacterium]